MAQGEFTKQECRETRTSIDAIFAAVPKSKKFNFIGELNDIYLFLASAEKAAPDKPENPPES